MYCRVHKKYLTFSRSFLSLFIFLLHHRGLYFVCFLNTGPGCVIRCGQLIKKENLSSMVGFRDHQANSGIRGLGVSGSRTMSPFHVAVPFPANLYTSPTGIHLDNFSLLSIDRHVSNAAHRCFDVMRFAEGAAQWVCTFLFKTCV